jgi:hypothetical protein
MWQAPDSCVPRPEDPEEPEDEPLDEYDISKKQFSLNSETIELTFTQKTEFYENLLDHLTIAISPNSEDIKLEA